MTEPHAAEKGGRPAGWQQPPVPRPALRCPHLGLAFAALTIGLHATGHEWVCGCGKVFVVVSNAGKDKRLVPDWRDRVTPPGKADR
jgi:hypothetical protein